jgi:hypothetical protein
MQSFRTKDDVFKRFGNPDIKRMADSTEIWIYNHDISGKASQSVAKTSPASDTTRASAAVPQNVYINFIFDRTGNIVGYKSSGVDLSYQKKISAGKNILNALGIAAILVVVVGLEVYNNSDISF